MKFLRTDVLITDENRDSLKISDLKEIGFELKFFCPSKAGYTLRFTKAWDMAPVAVWEDECRVLFVTIKLAQQIIDLIEEELCYDDMTTEEVHLCEKEKELLMIAAKAAKLLLFFADVCISF
jgi:hypothetical protein